MKNKKHLPPEPVDTGFSMATAPIAPPTASYPPPPINYAPPTVSCAPPPGNYLPPPGNYLPPGYMQQAYPQQTGYPQLLQYPATVHAQQVYDQPPYSTHSHVPPHYAQPPPPPPQYYGPVPVPVPPAPQPNNGPPPRPSSWYYRMKINRPQVRVLLAGKYIYIFIYNE